MKFREAPICVLFIEILFFLRVYFDEKIKQEAFYLAPRSPFQPLRENMKTKSRIFKYFVASYVFAVSNHFINIKLWCFSGA